MSLKQPVKNVFVAALFLFAGNAAFANSSPLLDLENLEDFLAEITVHENQLVPGQYEAAEFADDFQKRCSSLGYHCMQVFFGTENGTQHVANVIEVDYPWSTIVRKFVLVEPQTNQVVTIWVDDEIEDKMLPGVTWVDINTAYPWFVGDLQKSNNEYYFYVDQEYAAE